MIRNINVHYCKDQNSWQTTEQQAFRALDWQNIGQPKRRRRHHRTQIPDMQCQRKALISFSRNVEEELF